MSFDAAHLPRDEKERLCRELLAEFGVTKIKRTGDELRHSCPLPFGLHARGDVNPSASLNVEKLCFTCYAGCGSGGLLWFIATCRGTSATKARKWLGGQTNGDESALPQLLAYLDSLYATDRRRAAPIPTMSERVLEPWLLIHPYLTEVRGISEDNLMRFKVGFNGESNRIVLPHFFGGALVGWQTRRLVKDGTPKYLSSMDFPKYETLFNYDGSRDVVAAVEAPMTVVAKAHLTHMEATFGAQVTEKQVRLLAKHRRVILAFDNDKAGWKATRAVGDALGSYSEVFVAAHPYAEDLGDLPDEEVSRILDEQVVPYSLWRPPLGLKHFREEVCSE